MIDWVTDALATYRLVRLVTEDQVTANWRRRVGKRGPTADYFVHCSWCTSWWSAFLVLCVGRTPWGRQLNRALALSAAAGLISTFVNEYTSTFPPAAGSGLDGSKGATAGKPDEQSMAPGSHTGPSMPRYGAQPN